MKKKRQAPTKFDAKTRVKGDLTTGTPDETVRLQRRLLRAVSKLGTRANEGRVLFDLRGCDEIDPGGVLLLRYAFRQIWALGPAELWYMIPPRPAGAYLAQNFEHYQHGATEESPEVEDFLLRNLSDRQSMVQELSDWTATLQQSVHVDWGDVALWEQQVGELTTNCFQHGPFNDKMPVTLVAGRAWPDEERVEMAVLDFGRGIPHAISTVVDDTLIEKGDGRLISHAMTRGVTSRTERANQGAGLPGIVKAVKRNGGWLQIMSGNGIAYIRQGRKNSRQTQNKYANQTIQGTLSIISMKIRTED